MADKDFKIKKGLIVGDNIIVANENGVVIEGYLINPNSWEQLALLDQDVSTNGSPSFVELDLANGGINPVLEIDHTGELYSYSNTQQASTFNRSGTWTKLQITDDGNLYDGSVDDGSIIVALPFTFNFYGVDYTQVYACTNTCVFFTEGEDGTTWPPWSPDETGFGANISIGQDFYPAPNNGNFDITNGGSGYTPAVSAAWYWDVPLTNDRTGETIQADVYVNDGIITQAYWGWKDNELIEFSAEDFVVGDTYTVNPADIGGTGSGAVFTHPAGEVFNAGMYTKTDGSTYISIRWEGPLYDNNSTGEESPFMLTL